MAMKSNKIFGIPYFSTLAYIAMIVFINMAFSFAPLYNIGGSEVSPMDAVVGIIYLFRDFAQRELGHYVILAMAIGAGLSYYLAEPSVAIASVSAFLVAETIDWLIFTFTGMPLSKRLLYSAGISAPFDSLIFLAILGRISLLGLIIMSVSKFIGVILIWFAWRLKNPANVQRST